MTKQLIIFIKNPILGKVKSRLAKEVGEKQALAIYRDLLAKTRDELNKLKHVNCLLYYADFIDGKDEWNAELFEKRQQSSGNLGERMQMAFEEVREGKTVIIGSDCYDLQAKHINQAFSRLDNFDVVIGPANDGGYYLLGMNKNYPQLFEKIDWSTERVLTQTIRQVKSLKLTYCLLEELVDLDTFSDLEQSTYPYTLK